MIYELSQKFYFEAAHTLHRDIDVAGSRRIHGHTYHAEVMFIGVPNSTTGMVDDLGGIRKQIDGVRALLDHQFLDDVPGLGPATLENLCKFVFEHLQVARSDLAAVSIERQASGDKCVVRDESRAVRST